MGGCLRPVQTNFLIVGLKDKIKKNSPSLNKFRGSEILPCHIFKGAQNLKRVCVVITDALIGFAAIAFFKSVSL
jgi:hypothetical protein